MGESTVFTEQETDVIQEQPTSRDVVFTEAVAMADAAAADAVVTDALVTDAVVVTDLDADREEALTVEVGAGANGVAGPASSAAEAVDARVVGTAADDAVAPEDGPAQPAAKPLQAGVRPGLRAGLPR